MIFRYRNGKPETVNGEVNDFVTYLPLSSLIGFGLDQGQSMGGIDGSSPMSASPPMGAI